jgi:hypothetical protein
VTINSDTTLVGLLVRQLFKVTLSTSAFAGGDDKGHLKGVRAAATAKIYNASEKDKEIGVISSSAANTVGKNVTDNDSITVMVPYGDIVYFNGWSSSHSNHMLTLWTGEGQNFQDPRGGPWKNRSHSVANISRQIVTGDVNLGYFTVGTPLMVDLSGDGKADLLAGLEWRKLKIRRPSPNMGVYRSFDLDGTGKKEWEWVGKGDGLVVYTAGLKGTPTYKELFGTRTFDKTFKHGYEALATLDADGNGVLQGEELKDIGVWVDADSDAVAQTGEIRSAKDAGVSELSVKFEADADGNVSNTKGAKIGGRDVAVWDWISYAFPKTLPDNELARIDWTDKAPPAEFFKVEAQQGLKPMKMLPGGTLRVYRINDQLYVRATAKVEEKGDGVMDVLYPAEVTSDGLLRWGMQGLANTLMASGPDLYGLTLAGENQYGLWSAKLVSGSMASVFETQ